MIDSGATGNYVDPRSLRRLRIRAVRKMTPEPLAGLNGESLGGLITAESGTIPLNVLNHLEYINLDVTSLGGYDVVLGIPWLKNHNPNINWRTETLESFDCNCDGTSGRSQGKARNTHLSRRPGRWKVIWRFGGEPIRGIPAVEWNDRKTTPSSKAVAPRSVKERRPTGKKEVSVPADREKENDTENAPSEEEAAWKERFATVPAEKGNEQDEAPNEEKTAWKRGYAAVPAEEENDRESDK